ncbi:MAG: hypothetical protein JETT_2894 [Candidatus Jettenia ecosi]|uniref:Uncharacterized protein n=1 Tax=Candidatus Jettenia ecosi TaxID=2494326 RepID=A0A533QDS1_9BACT|nr:MAG: hypothetical protein JETT_2894 [Candidatus Jettenia ecosi]
MQWWIKRSESTKGINSRHEYELYRQPLSIFTIPLIKMFNNIALPPQKPLISDDSFSW